MWLFLFVAINEVDSKYYILNLIIFVWPCRVNRCHRLMNLINMKQQLVDLSAVEPDQKISSNGLPGKSKKFVKMIVAG